MTPEPAFVSHPFSAPYRATGSAGAAKGLLYWYQLLVLGGALGVLYANLPIYAYVLNPALLPKYAFFAIFALIAPLMVIHARALKPYLASPFVLWASFMLVLNLVHMAAMSPDGDLGGAVLIDNRLEARQALIMTRAQYIVFAVFIGFMAFISRGKSYLRVLTALALVLPCAVVLDFAVPGLLYPADTNGAVLGRAAAMFINPTTAGEAMLHVALLACAVTPKRARGALFLLCGAGIVATFSRSSIIAWVLLLGLLVWRKTLPKSTLVAAALVLGALLIYLGSFQHYLESRQDFEGASSNILSRLDFFSSFELKDDSSEERADVIKGGWQLFTQDPLFGAGAGATQFWSHRGSTHNQLLLLAAEYGLFGIGAWLWLLVILWRGQFFEDRGLQYAMVFLFVCMSMFTHLMLDSASFWLATFSIISMRSAPGARST